MMCLAPPLSFTKYSTSSPTSFLITSSVVKLVFSARLWWVCYVLLQSEEEAVFQCCLLVGNDPYSRYEADISSLLFSLLVESALSGKSKLLVIK